MRFVFCIALFFSSTLAMAFEAKKPSFALQPFELTWMNHEDPTTIYRSADYPNAVFVVEAYFKNCPYCNDNAPLINRLQNRYADNPDVQIIDVGRDCRNADYTTWINRHNPNHPVLKDCNMAVLGQLGVRAYPTTYILDCNLNVKKTHVGAMNTSGYNSLVREIDAVIAAGCNKSE